jgi:hypothetical protein
MVFPSQISGLGAVAARLGVPIHRIAYIIRTRGIRPLLVAGGRNFYS